jgi:agmatinase
MHNVLARVPKVTKIVQVGVRDYCDEEVAAIENSGGRVKTYFDHDIKERIYEGETWKQLCDEIISNFPQQVYISFDIDGLDPKLCGNTGTPVHGGFEAEQIQYLFKKLVDSGRKIVAFDLNEVSCGEHSQDSIDANVGARILYKMCNLLMKCKKSV